jgi:hypothetical protein
MSLSDDVCRCAQCTREERASADKPTEPRALYVKGKEIIDRAAPALPGDAIDALLGLGHVMIEIKPDGTTRVIEAGTWWC